MNLSSYSLHLLLNPAQSWVLKLNNCATRGLIQTYTIFMRSPFTLFTISHQSFNHYFNSLPLYDYYLHFYLFVLVYGG